MDIDFTIGIGEFEVIKSGVVITHLDKGIQFHINGLTFDISFKKDNTTDKSLIKAEVASNDSKCLLLSLINYDNTLGQGLVKPAEVGTLNNRILYLHFMVSKLGDTETRIFEYTWLVKDKDNGE